MVLQTRTIRNCRPAIETSRAQPASGPVDIANVEPVSPRFSLSVWLTGAVVATALAAVACTLVLVESFAHRHAERNAAASLALVARHMRDELDHGMQQHFEEIASLAALRPLRESRSVGDVREMLDEIQRSFPEFAWIGLADADGRVIAGVNGLLDGASVAARPWYTGALAKPYVGDVHAAVLLEKLLPRQREPWRFVDIAAPVFDGAGRRVAVLGAHLSWEWARAVHASLLDPGRQADGIEVFLVSREGNVLIGPKGSENRPLPAALRPRTGADAGASGPAVDAGVAYFAASTVTRGFGRYPGLGWSVVVRQPVDLALADYRLLRDEILAGGGAVFALASLAAVWMARRLSSPLRRMSRSLQAGEVVVDVTRHGLYREAHQLALAFAELFSRQRADARALEAANASLEARIRERTATLEDAQTLLRGIADNLPVLISYLDREQRVQFCNATYFDWFGVDPVAHIGRPMHEVVGEALWAPRLPNIVKALQTGETVRFESQAEIHGGMRDLETTYVPHRGPGGEVLGLYTLSSDITALKQARRAMERLAHVDTLTGLPNRYQLNEQLPLALARGRRAATGVAVLFIDVDRFKQVNDSLGHAAGDAVLLEFAERLKGCVRTTDLVARLAGDEFVVVLEGLQTLAEAELVAGKLVAAVRMPMRWHGRQVEVGASIGVAYDARCATAPDVLLSQADAALYEVKRGGRAAFRVSAPMAALAD